MAEDLFNIVFKGELVRSFEIDTVKKNLGQLFKIDGAKVDALFSGRAVVLKRNLNFENANKYRVAIKKAGARVDVEPVSAEKTAAAETPKPKTQPSSGQGKAVFGERSPQSQESAQVASVQKEESSSQPKERSAAPAAAGAASAQPAVATPNEGNPMAAASAHVEDNSGFSLADVGSDVLSASERKEEVVADVDVSSLSVKDEGGDLLNEDEKREYETLIIDLSALDVSPQEGNLVSEDEIERPAPVKVDVSQLSMGEPGENLEPPKPPAPPPPDTSNIKLSE